MRFVINGGKKLKGEILVAGSKNAATPVIAATLLTEHPCIISNIPRIDDVHTMLDILASMGSKQRWIDDHTVEIINDEINSENLDQILVKKIRSSILIVGPMLARFGKVKFSIPGGCSIGARPIDTHLNAFENFGADVKFDEKKELYEITLGDAFKKEIVLREFSVTATENILMLGVKYPVIVKLAAQEPHVVCLGEFLGKLGADISGLGTHNITMAPDGKNLKRIEHRIVNDYLEMSTFAILGAATKSDIAVSGIYQDQIDSVLAKFRDMGIIFEIKGNKLYIFGTKSKIKSSKIDTRIYPGIPTDIQALFGVLATQAYGKTLIFDTLYDGRLKYIDELKKMGAKARILDPHRAEIEGPTDLNGTEVQSLDLRAGATLLVAALTARGKSVIGRAEQIDRGYEKLDERLRKLGANIKRVA